jgi:hypothetical protein
MQVTQPSAWPTTRTVFRNVGNKRLTVTDARYQQVLPSLANTQRSGNEFKPSSAFRKVVFSGDLKLANNEL